MNDPVMDNTVVEGEPHVEMVVATFSTEKQAREGYDNIREAEKQGEILMVDSAEVYHDEKNQLHMKEEADVGARPGALVGAGIGMILGTIAGPLGLIVGGAAGALLGGATTGATDTGIPDEFLEDMASTLTPGSALVLAVVDQVWADRVSQLLAVAGGEVSTRPLPPELARALKVDVSGTQADTTTG
jgi:uncharacterized membrane protein